MVCIKKKYSVLLSFAKTQSLLLITIDKHEKHLNTFEGKTFISKD